MFIYLFWKRERACGGGAERERIPIRLCAVSTEPADAGLNLTHPGIMTRAKIKSQALNQLSPPRCPQRSFWVYSLEKTPCSRNHISKGMKKAFTKTVTTKLLVLTSIVLAQLSCFRWGEHPGFYWLLQFLLIFPIFSTLNLKLKEMP